MILLQVVSLQPWLLSDMWSSYNKKRGCAGGDNDTCCTSVLKCVLSNHNQVLTLTKERQLPNHKHVPQAYIIKKIYIYAPKKVEMISLMGISKWCQPINTVLPPDANSLLSMRLYGMLTSACWHERVSLNRSPKNNRGTRVCLLWKKLITNAERNVDADVELTLQIKCSCNTSQLATCPRPFCRFSCTLLLYIRPHDVFFLAIHPRIYLNILLTHKCVYEWGIYKETWFSVHCVTKSPTLFSDADTSTRLFNKI